MEERISSRTSGRSGASAEIDEEFQGDRLAEGLQAVEKGTGSMTANMQPSRRQQKMGHACPPRHLHRISSSAQAVRGRTADEEEVTPRSRTRTCRRARSALTVTVPRPVPVRPISRRPSLTVLTVVWLPGEAWRLPACCSSRSLISLYHGAVAEVFQNRLRLPPRIATRRRDRAHACGDHHALSRTVLPVIEQTQQLVRCLPRMWSHGSWPSVASWSRYPAMSDMWRPGRAQAHDCHLRRSPGRSATSCQKRRRYRACRHQRVSRSR